MALVEIFHEPGEVDFDALSGAVTTATESLIEVSVGTATFHYYGSFSYDLLGNLTGGTFLGLDMEDSANGGLQYRVSGINVDVGRFVEFATSTNPDALESFLFNGNDTMVGSDGDDDLSGFTGTDSLIGAGGNDTLTGGQDFFADTLAGGAGDDTYNVRSGDIVLELAGDGVDTLVTDFSFVLPDNVEKLVLVGSADTSGRGNNLPNTLTGNSGHNLLEGLAGNDTLYGSWGDTLRGGTGDDVYILSNDSAVEESAGGGVDTLVVTRDTYLPAAVENLVFTGSSRSWLSGNDLPNVLTGNDVGCDFNGWGGDDTMRGGSGNDTYMVDSARDVVSDTGGMDLVRTQADGYVLPVGIENLELWEAEAVRAANGNELDNVIRGNQYSNLIFAGAGNDSINGGGGLGVDTVDGGDGVDHFIYAAGGFGHLVRSGDSVLLVPDANFYPTATLRNIERIDWGGATETVHTALDIEGKAGAAYRLYQAAFDRTPDESGLGFHIHELDIGLSLEYVASTFISAIEFKSLYGADVDDTHWVTLLYRNVLHREPEAAGLSFHLWELGVGLSRAAQLAEFSESAENQANVIGSIQDGIVYRW